MKILLKRLIPGMLGGFQASLDSGGSSFGNTMGEAVGNLVMAKAEILGLEIEIVSSTEKSVTKRKKP